MFLNNPGSNNMLNSNNKDNTQNTIFYLRVISACIGVLAIVKLILGDYNGFNSDLMTCLFIFLTSFCINGFIAGFLVVSLLFSLVLTSVFFLLQIQNIVFSIPSQKTKISLTIQYCLNGLGFIFYSAAIYFSYKYCDESGFAGNSNGYNLLNDNPVTQQRYGTVENELQNNNFKAFTGEGKTLDA